MLDSALGVLGRASTYGFKIHGARVCWRSKSRHRSDRYRRRTSLHYPSQHAPRSGVRWGWHMSEKHERVRGDRFFYYFVDFGKSPSDRHGCISCRADRGEHVSRIALEVARQTRHSRSSSSGRSDAALFSRLRQRLWRCCRESISSGLAREVSECLAYSQASSKHRLNTRQTSNSDRLVFEPAPVDGEQPNVIPHCRQRTLRKIRVPSGDQ